MDTFSLAGITLIGLCLVLVVFVAAVEAGLISISRARVRLMVGQGVPRAEILHSYIQERESLLRALALARSLAVVAVAALVVAVLTRERGHSAVLIGAIILGTLASVALLEAIPRAVIARGPERWGLRLSPFMGAFNFFFGGPARILDRPFRAFSRREPSGDDEMLRLMELEEEEGAIEEDERKMIRGVFGLEETTVRAIMTPRIDIAALDTECTADEAIKLIIERGFSRIPLYEKNADTIVGIVYAKDLFRCLAEAHLPQKLIEIARPANFIPESKRVDDLLTEMRQQRVHMSIVVDEYGGTAGLATIEDLLEEIVGEIEDEYDHEEQRVVVLSEREALVDGRVGIDELNDLFHTSIEAEEFDTVGGCVFHILGRMPVVDDEAQIEGLVLQVVSVDGHRVKRLRVTQAEQTSEGAGGNGNGNGNGKRSEGVA